MIKRRYEMPFLLMIAMALLGFIGLLGGLVVTLILGMTVFGDGPFSMNGQPVSKSEFVDFLIPFSAVYMLGCALAGTAAWGLYRERPWSRVLLVTYATAPLLAVPLVGLVPGVESSDLLAAIVPFLIPPAFAWWYLYRKRNVVEYYDAIQGTSSGEGEHAL